jgi:hypothetical protein
MDMFALTSSTANHEHLRTRLARAHCCTPQLFWSVLEEACPRSVMLGDSGDAIAIRRFVEAGAWTDAALALARLELPFWSVRRLQFDGGEWHCALSRHRELPDWLDDAREARHPDLANAILSALLEARAAAGPDTAAPPNDKEDAGSIAVCCENFS